jgi:hypothetical protein
MVTGPLPEVDGVAAAQQSLEAARPPASGRPARAAEVPLVKSVTLPAARQGKLLAELPT